MDGAKEDVDEELEEELLIVVANAVVDPGAVVIHSRDAALADRAVMAEGRLDRVALPAVLADDILQIFESRVVQNNVLIDLFLRLRRLSSLIDYLLLSFGDASEPGDHLLHGFKASAARGNFFLAFENSNVYSNITRRRWHKLL